MTHPAVMFRMWLHLCGSNVGGLGATRIRGRGFCIKSWSVFCIKVDACSSLSALSKVVQGKCVSNFLLCHTCGFELTFCLWAMDVGQLIYPTDGTCELPDLHCLHLQPELFHPPINQTLLWLSSGITDPSFSSGSACTSLLIFNPSIASLQNLTGIYRKSTASH